MGHSRGLRSGTRYMFSKQFRTKGRLPLSTYMVVNKKDLVEGQKDKTKKFKPLRMGDYVDIIANAGVQRGMPAKFYHGRTGIIFNIAKRAVGVEVNKVVRGRVEKKRVNVRIEHIRVSTCREDFLKRVNRNDEIKRQAKAKGQRVPITAIKRFPVQPHNGYVVSSTASASGPKTLAPIPFDDML